MSLIFFAKVARISPRYKMHLVGGLQAVLDIVSGRSEPSGLLPMQLPADMETVETQKEDVPRDMIPYTDAQGNRYDFAFGMDWSGIIRDKRVRRYGDL